MLAEVFSGTGEGNAVELPLVRLQALTIKLTHMRRYKMFTFIF
jgi:hypothetical protein